MLGRSEKFIIPLAIFIFIAFFAAFAAYAGITGTKHDLSTTGTGTIKAAPASNVTERCVFCHTPHAASKEGPLWNRSLSTATYIVESAPVPTESRITTPGQPDGSSRLCLSCHDGTVAIGLLLNTPGTGTTFPTPISMVGVSGSGTMPSTAAGYLGTDLRLKHLLSIEYDTGLYNEKLTKCSLGYASIAVVDPTTIPANDVVQLRPTAHSNGYTPDTPGSASLRLGIQCRTCHDPHDNSRGAFLVKGSTLDNTPLCDTCHVPCP